MEVLLNTLLVTVKAQIMDVMIGRKMVKGLIWQGVVYMKLENL